MKRLVLLLLFSLGMFVISPAQNENNFAVCKVLEKKRKVKVMFSSDVKYLGSEYKRNVLYFEKEKLHFMDGQEAVSYLCASWSWILCGNPTQLKNGNVLWTLKHEIKKNVPNSVTNMSVLKTQNRRYYTTDDDDMYYGDRSESH